jgi:hypothetical protein
MTKRELKHTNHRRRRRRRRREENMNVKLWKGERFDEQLIRMMMMMMKMMGVEGTRRSLEKSGNMRTWRVETGDWRRGEGSDGEKLFLKERRRRVGEGDERILSWRQCVQQNPARCQILELHPGAAQVQQCHKLLLVVVEWKHPPRLLPPMQHQQPATSNHLWKLIIEKSVISLPVVELGS